jgi:hypothetical protein
VSKEEAGFGQHSVVINASYQLGKMCATIGAFKLAMKLCAIAN